MRRRKLSLKKQKGITFSSILHETWVKYFTIHSPKQLKFVSEDSQFQSLYSTMYIEPFNSDLIIESAEKIESDPYQTLVTLLNLNRTISPESIIFCELLTSNEQPDTNIQEIIQEVFPELLKSFIIIIYHIQKNIDIILSNQKVNSIPKYIIENIHLLTQFLFTTHKPQITDFLIILSSFLNIFNTINRTSELTFFTSPISPTFLQISNQLMTFICLNHNENYDIDFVIEYILNFLILVIKNPGLKQSYYNTYLKFASIINQISSYIIGNQQYIRKLTSIVIDAFNLSLLNFHQDNDYWIDFGFTTIDVMNFIYPSLKNLNIEADAVNSLITFIFSMISVKETTKLIVMPQSPIKCHVSYDQPNIVKAELLNKDIINGKEVNDQSSDQYNPELHLKSDLTNLLKKISQLVSVNPDFSKYYIETFLDMQEKSNSAAFLYFSLLLFTMNVQNFTNSLIEIKKWSVIMPEQVYDGKIYDEHFLSLTEVLVKMVFSISNQCPFNIFNHIRELILTMKSNSIKNCLKLLNSLLYIDKIKFAKTIEPTMIIESLITVDSSFRSTMIQRGPQEKLVLVRSLILRFIFTLLRMTNTFYFILHLNSFVDYTVSILSETTATEIGKEFLSKIFRHAISPRVFLKIDKLISNCFIYADNREWQELLDVFVNVITSNLPFSYEKIVSAFIASKSYATFIKFSSFWNGDTTSFDSSNADTDEMSDLQKVSLLKIVKNSLTVFSQMIVSSPQLKSAIENPNVYFIRKFSSAIERIDVDEELLTLFVKFITLEFSSFDVGKCCQLKNSIGIPLLFKSSVGTKYFDRTLSFLIDATERNTFNRYMCFDSNLLDLLISNIQKYPNNTNLMRLIVTIGSNFIRKSELMKLFDLFKKSMKLDILKSIVAMTEQCHSPTSFFHFTNDSSQFVKKDIHIGKYFAVEFSVELETESFKPGVFVHIIRLNSEKQQILLTNKNGELYLTLLGVNGISDNKLSITALPHQWDKYKIVVSNKEFSIFFNDNLKDTITDESFEIKEENTFSFIIYQTYGNFESIKFWNSQKTLVGEYSAQYRYMNQCFNSIRDSDSYEQADFNGMSVFGSRNISNIIPSCGGPKILLKLFNVLEKSDEKTEILTKLLTIISNLISNNEEIFIGQNFFIILSKYLIDIDRSFITIDVINVLLKIYKSISDKTLNQEMIENIWLRSDFWQSFSTDAKLYYINSVYPIISKYELVDVLPKFIITLGTETNSEIYEAFWTMVNNFVRCRITDDDFRFLLSISYGSSLHYIHAQKLILDVAISNSQFYTEFIENNSLLSILELFHSPQVNTRITGLLLFCIFSRSTDIDTTDYALQIVQYYVQTKQDETMNELCLSFVCGAKISYNVSEYNLSLSYPKLIPLFGSLLQFTNEENRRKYSDKFFDILSKTDDLILENCLFWVIYISEYCSDDSMWIDATSKFIKSVSDVETFINLVYMTKKENIKSIRKMLANVFEKFQNMELFEICINFSFFDVENQSQIIEYITLQGYSQNATNSKFYSVYVNNVISSEDEYRLSISMFMFALENSHSEKKFFGFDISYLCGLLYSRMSQYDLQRCLIFAPLLISLYSESENRHEFTPFSFLLSDNEIESGFLEVEKKLIYDGSLPLAIEDVYHMISQNIPDFQGRLIAKINEDASKYTSLVSSIFKPSNIPSVSREINKFFTTEMENSFIAEKRLLQMGKQIFSIYKRKKTDKYKMLACTDTFGRPTMFKNNYEFDIHEEASKLRDAGIENKKVEIKVDNVYKKEKDIRSFIAIFTARMMTVQHIYSGVLYILKDTIEFESSSVQDIIGTYSKDYVKITSFKTNAIDLVLKRKNLHIECGCEIFTNTKSFLFHFEDKNVLEKFFTILQNLSLPNCRGIQTKSSKKLFHQLQIDKMWQTSQISNYEYLYYVNIFSGRSFHDLSQYPVYPWIIKDYKSETIDFRDENIYRDLSKPLGALNEKRLEQLIEGYEEMDQSDFPCIYRFHYSTAAYVISYLIRQEPYTTLHIALQGGKFDIANRLFLDMNSSWKSVSDESPDFRELIPQFFCNFEFLLNSNGFDLGTIDKQKVNDVVLPQWCQNSPQFFIYMNRMALESNYVSKNINKWIDLVFGVNQKSEEFHNIFHPFSYNDIVCSEYWDTMMKTIQNHAANFGIVPDQLFTLPSPSKTVIKECLFYNFDMNQKEIKILFTKHVTKDKIKSVHSQKNRVKYITHLSVIEEEIDDENNTVSTRSFNFKTSSSSSNSMITKLFGQDKIIFCPPWSVRFEVHSLVDPAKKQRPNRIHAFPISCIACDHVTIVTGSSDSSVVVWDRNSSFKSLISHHKSQISALDVNDNMGYIASGDVDGILIISRISDVSCWRNASLGNRISFLSISNIGFIFAVTTDISDSQAMTSTIYTIDMSGNIISETALNSVATCCYVYDTIHGTSFSIVCCEDKKVLIYDSITHNLIGEGVSPELCVTSCFVETSSSIYVSTENGNIYCGKLLLI